MNSPVVGCSLAIVGDGSVGKSTITSAFKNDGFVKVYKQTIGVDFYEKQLQVRDNLSVSLKVWDVGGQSIQSKNLQSYVAGSDVVLFIYDVTNRESFANLDDWLSHVRKYAKPGCIKFLVGNKVDLIALRQISVKQHDAFIAENSDIQGTIFISSHITFGSPRELLEKVSSSQELQGYEALKS
jgi:Ras-related protein Rab-28